MAEISAQMIKELRDRTNVAMGKCKEALVEANGDMEAAIDILRKKGIAGAVKKEGREANEGMIGIGESNDAVAIVEVNSETDFVANNVQFRKFAADVAEEIAKTKPASLESFLQQKYSKDPSLTVDEFRATLIQSIGENIRIKRFLVIPKTNDISVGVYSHLGGKIVTAVEIEGSNQESSLSKDIAMHVAAASPEYLNPESVPESIITREKEIAREQLKGKPANIIDNILKGKLNAFYDQACLVNQKYIRDDSLSISELVNKRGKEVNKPLKVNNFIRWSLGQSF
jgi:elongation factor Ts